MTVSLERTIFETLKSPSTAVSDLLTSLSQSNSRIGTLDYFEILFCHLIELSHISPQKEHHIRLKKVTLLVELSTFFLSERLTQTE